MNWVKAPAQDELLEGAHLRGRSGGEGRYNLY